MDRRGDNPSALRNAVVGLCAIVRGKGWEAMSTQLELGNRTDRTDSRAVMNGKPVFTRPAKTVINFESNFSHKLLCDGPTFSAGDACVYSCAFCYVPDLMRKLRASVAYDQVEQARALGHDQIVVRRGGAAEIARRQLEKAPAELRRRRLVIYSSPLVDVAGNMELVRETVEICRVILEMTSWDIRLLSKSNLLPKVAEGLMDGEVERREEVRERLIFGVSTGTLDDGLAKAFEDGTPLVSKRIQSLHWLQDNHFRTYGMICPSLPLGGSDDYYKFAEESAAAIRADRCEHVWAEVINLRGESFTRTCAALDAGGFQRERERLHETSINRDEWESYARATFEGHAAWLPKGKLRFLQYVTPSTRSWWERQKGRGAVVL